MPDEAHEKWLAAVAAGERSPTRQERKQAERDEYREWDED